MKKLNLYLDFEFTSLSPDAQPVSLGIVSDEIEANVPVDEIREFNNGTLKLKNHKLLVDNGFGMKEFISKSFYAEFSDFDINRCDDWVKENVLSKLTKGKPIELETYAIGDTDLIKTVLKEYLEQFSDYEMQIVVDCGTWDFYWFLQLVAEWDKIDNIWHYGDDFNSGLPKLPSNISPVPQDLNDIIAIKKGISPKEAFDLNREVLAFGWHENQGREMVNSFKERELEFFGLPKENKESKHNSLWDAKIIKEIYQKLIQ